MKSRTNIIVWLAVFMFFPVLSLASQENSMLVECRSYDKEQNLASLLQFYIVDMEEKSKDDSFRTILGVTLTTYEDGEPEYGEFFMNVVGYFSKTKDSEGNVKTFLKDIKINNVETFNLEASYGGCSNNQIAGVNFTCTAFLY